MGTLYALLGPRRETDVRLIQIDAAIQDALGILFPIYEQQFLDGVEEEIRFDGGYSPDENQILFVEATGEMNEIAAQIGAGAVGRDIYNPDADVVDDIRALIWAYQDGQVEKLLVQNFTRAQALSRRGTMLRWSDGETFRRLEDETLLIDQKIHGILRQGRFFFKKFGVAKRIFDLEHEYREATAEDIEQFLACPILAVEDEDAFSGSLNSIQRKLIFAVQRAGTLEGAEAERIRQRADAVGIDVEIQGNRVQLPVGPRLTSVLRFFDHRMYRSPVNDQRFMANSRRAL